MKNNFDSILIGFLIFTIGRTVHGYLDNDNLSALICSIGWVYILKGWMNQGKSHLVRNSYKTLLGIYSVVVVVMIIRGYMIDYPFIWRGTPGMINYHLFDTYYLLPYIMPMALLIPWQAISFRKLIKWLVPFVIFGSFLSIIFFPQIIEESILMNMGEKLDYYHYSISSAFVGPFLFFLFCHKYLDKKKWNILLGAAILLTIVTAIAGRRGNTAIHLFLISISLMFVFKEKKTGSKVFLFLVYGLMAAGAVFFVLHSNLFGYIFERGMEDTRTGVEQAMMLDMDNWELVFGKGLNGRYYCPVANQDTDYLNGYRYGIETGFLNLVLKGGYLMAILYVLLLLIPSYKGVFKSNNQLCKALGWFIFISILELYPFGWLAFSIKFLIIWVGVSLCLNANIRKMTDQQIYEHFFR